METRLKKIPSIIIPALFLLFLFSCSESQFADDEKKIAAENQQSDTNLKAAPVNLPGRHLAANCFQCHGTNGYAGELKIAEQSASSIIGDMKEMKSKPVGENIMNVHAQAYTDEEIRLIAEYISKQ